MNFSEIYKTYEELKNILSEKKQSIISRNLEKMCACDEEIIVISGKISKFNKEQMTIELSEDEKQSLKKLGKEIKVLEENNEILIKHSLNVINDILSGILNIAESKNSSYNSKGESCTHKQTLDISSITEEA